MNALLYMPRAARPFLRFVVGEKRMDAATLDGVFRFSDRTFANLSLADRNRPAIERLHAWFNDHLIVPRITKGPRGESVACWFRSDAGEHLIRIWELARLLRESGYPVRYLWTDHPGEIIYYDEFQIVACRPRKGRRRDCFWEQAL
jgi:hypothetical protein